MKGVGALIVAVMALILLLTIVTGSAIYLAAKSENIIRTSQETAVIGGINYMEILKDSLKQSLAYSSYQAFYTLSQNGGYQKVSDAPKSYNNIPYWRIYDDRTGYPSLWGPNLEKLTNDYMKEYTKALTGTSTSTVTSTTSSSTSTTSITSTSSSSTTTSTTTSQGVTIPDYQITIAFGSSDITVKAFSKNAIEFFGQFFKLKDKSSMTQTIKTFIHSLFDQATASYYTTDSIQNAIVDARDSQTKDSLTKNSPECIRQTVSYCQNQPVPDCESLYKAYCPTNFKNFITQNLLSLQSPRNLPQSPIDTETRLDPTDIKVNHISLGPTIISTTPNSCNCHQECPDEGCVTVCVSATITISCTYNNYGASKVLVTYTDTKNKYPVYDNSAGTTDMRFTKLNFYVISGSDYTQAKDLIKP